MLFWQIVKSNKMCKKLTHILIILFVWFLFLKKYSYFLISIFCRCSLNVSHKIVCMFTKYSFGTKIQKQKNKTTKRNKRNLHKCTIYKQSLPLKSIFIQSEYVIFGEGEKECLTPQKWQTCVETAVLDTTSLTLQEYAN